MITRIFARWCISGATSTSRSTPPSSCSTNGAGKACGWSDPSGVHRSRRFEAGPDNAELTRRFVLDALEGRTVHLERVEPLLDALTASIGRRSPDDFVVHVRRHANIVRVETVCSDLAWLVG